MNVVGGDLVATSRRFAIVVSRWNELYSERLLEGAHTSLVRHGASADAIQVFRCPGCFELPMVADRVAQTGSFDAILCLGILVRGSTPHFDYIASVTASGVAQAARDHKIPITFGVLTCDTLEQVIERSGTKAGNKGEEAALAAIEMANLYAAMNG